MSSRGTGGANTTAEGGEWRLLGAAGGLNPPAAPRRGDVVCGTNAGRETCAPACSPRLTWASVQSESSCLHLDQGGDENSDDAFPLVVPTGFEPVSLPREVEPGRFRDLRRDPRRAADLRIQFLVDSGRYPSVFDVMRDIHGITGRAGLQPPCFGLRTTRVSEGKWKLLTPNPEAS